MTDYNPADFFTRLYRGFESEHFVAGKLFGCGLEALKMPGDFGFDLLVDNQMERALKKNLAVRVKAFPYALQVKSRKVNERRRRVNNNRSEYRVNFDISIEEYDLLISHPSSFLVCVALSDYGAPSADVDYFWLSGQQVEALKHALYFLEKKGADGKDYLTVQAVVRERSSQTRDAIIAGTLGLMAGFADADKVRKYLQKTLPARCDSNDNSSEYIALERPPGNNTMGDGPYRERFHKQIGEDGTGKAAKLFSSQLNLARLGEVDSFPVDDSTMKAHVWTARGLI